MRPKYKSTQGVYYGSTLTIEEKRKDRSTKIHGIRQKVGLTVVPNNVPTNCDLSWGTERSMSLKTREFLSRQTSHITQDGITLQIGNLSIVYCITSMTMFSCMILY